VRRRFLLAGAAIAAAVATVLAAPSALANGRFPSANQLAIGPSAPQTLVLRTTFGLILSRDGGATWDWICERGTIEGGYGGPEDPAIGVTASGTIISGLFEGLVVSLDTGCSWHLAPGAVMGQPIVDDVVRPDDPHSALALTNVFAANDDAGEPTFSSQVFASTDDGANWATHGVAIDPSYILETLEVAKSDVHRIYASGVRGSGLTAQAALLVSIDDGQTWTPRAVPLDMTVERAPFIAAVDPNNADKLYVRTSGSATNRLLVSPDAGKTWSVAYQGKGPLLGFALSADGTKVWVGGPSDGLLEADATAATLTFAQKSTIHVQCLKSQGTTLYACSDEASGFILGKSEDDGATFCGLLHLSYGIRGPLACPANASASICTQDWPMQRDSLGITEGGPAPPGLCAVPAGDGGPSGDAGDSGTGGGGGGGTGGGTTTSTGCKCSTPGLAGGIEGASAALAATAAAVLAARLRRRRRRR
jgi:photosystem II stability/assembly factor-like uncharacterized protein